MTNVRIVPGPEGSVPFDIDNAHSTSPVPERFVEDTPDALFGLALPVILDTITAYDQYGGGYTIDLEPFDIRGDRDFGEFWDAEYDLI